MPRHLPVAADSKNSTALTSTARTPGGRTVHMPPEVRPPAFACLRALELFCDDFLQDVLIQAQIGHQLFELSVFRAASAVPGPRSRPARHTPYASCRRSVRVRSSSGIARQAPYPFSACFRIRSALPCISSASSLLRMMRLHEAES